MQKTFQYSTKKKGSKPKQVGTTPPADPADEETMGLVNGIMPDSIEEWRMAKALWRYNIDFKFQVVVRGGGGLRGTIILDYLVYNPFATPVPVYGEYWHQGDRRAEDLLQEAYMARVYGRQPVPAMAKADLYNQDAANAWVAANLV